MAPAPEVRQVDGSLVLERRPDAAAKPAHVLPKGAKVERIVQVKIQPTVKDSLTVRPRQFVGNETPLRDPQSGLWATDGPQTPSGETQAVHQVSFKGINGQKNFLLPPPITLDLTLVRMPDGGRRVVASSLDGEIVGGVDVPVDVPALTVRVPKNAMGGMYMPGGYGAWYHRALGRRWIVGAQVRRTPAHGIAAARTDADLLFGWRW